MEGRRPKSGIISTSPKTNSFLVMGKYLLKIMKNQKEFVLGEVEIIPDFGRLPSIK